MKRFASLLCACLLSFSLFLVPASAASVDDTMTVTVTNMALTTTVDLPRSGQGSTYLKQQNWSVAEAYNNKAYYPNINFVCSSNTTLTGAVGLYVSFTFDNASQGVYNLSAPSTASELLFLMSASYLTENGTRSQILGSGREVNSALVSQYKAMYTVSAKTTASEGLPITSMAINFAKDDGVVKVTVDSGSYVDYYSSTRFYIPSASLIATESSGELEALETIADDIAQQTEILQGMYADIIAICNAIYQRCGDMVTAQNLTNEYFAQIVPIVQSLNTTTSNIYTLLGTQFALLISTLQQESLSIQQAIADAELRLEEYLKPVIDYITELEEQTGEGPSTLPDHKTDIDGFNNDTVGIDSDGQVGFSGILPFFTTFSFVLSILGLFIGIGILKILMRKGLG